MKTDFIWIETALQLRELAEGWLQCDAIAIDTEFMRVDTFYPIAALIQIGDGDNTYLLDPLAVTELTPLAEVLTAPQVIKVFHACSEDLEVFNTLLGVVPQPLYDTQIAAAMLGESFSLGYAALMKILLDVDIPKGETRSNWLRRPLTDSQCLYAAMDVSHLFEGFKLLFERGEQSDRNSWILAEGERMLENQRFTQRSNIQYLKVKSAWKLHAKSLAVLMRLCEFRELRVRKLDIPRSRWLKDAMLWEIAKRQPAKLAELGDIQGIPASFVRNNGDRLLSLVAEGLSTSADKLPELLPKPLGPESAATVKRLRAVATGIAEEQQLAVELLLKKKDIEQLIRLKPRALAELPSNLQGWRASLLGEALFAAL